VDERCIVVVVVVVVPREPCIVVPPESTSTTTRDECYGYFFRCFPDGGVPGGLPKTPDGYVSTRTGMWAKNRSSKGRSDAANSSVGQERMDR
jgi:hypothetical protein